MINNLLKVLTCAISIGMAVAGTDGQVRGKVVNIEGESLIGAQIYIESLGIAVVIILLIQKVV